MKKNRKLVLNRETIRRIDDAQASAVAGGFIRTQDGTCTTTDGYLCPTNHPVGCGGQTSPKLWC